MLAEPTGDLEQAALSRLYFLGLLEEDQRRGVLQRIESRVAADLAQLEAIEAQAARQEIPEGWRDVATYQLAALDYGLASHRHALEWFQGKVRDLS